MLLSSSKKTLQFDLLLDNIYRDFKVKSKMTDWIPNSIRIKQIEKYRKLSIRLLVSVVILS